MFHNKNQYVATSKRKLSGMTLVEIMIAVSISTIAFGMVMSSFLYSLRSIKSQRSTLKLAENSMKFQRTVKERATTAERFVLNGNTVRIIQADESISEMRFDDGGDSTTLEDNKIIWDPDVTVSDDEAIMLTRVIPMPGTPVFQQPGKATNLRVRFRLGDRSDQNNEQDNAETGIGVQTYVMDAIFTGRNGVE